MGVPLPALPNSTEGDFDDRVSGHGKVRGSFLPVAEGAFSPSSEKAFSCPSDVPFYVV
jgi:hypothetical protein